MKWLNTPASSSDLGRVSDTEGLFSAVDYGLLAMAFDPAANSSNSTPLATAGTLYGIRLKLITPATITNIVLPIFTAGATLTAGQCFAALYQNNTLKAQTADQATAWASTGMKTMALSSAQSAAAGYVDIVMWFNGTTGPAPTRGHQGFTVNGALAAANARYFTANTGVTTTAPASLGTKTSFSTAYWVGVS